MEWRVIVFTIILLLLVKRCDSATSTTTTITTTTTTTKSSDVTTSVQQKPSENKDSVAGTRPPSNNGVGENNQVITTQSPPQKLSGTTTTQAPVVTNHTVQTTKSQQEQEPENPIQKATTEAAGNQNPDQTLVITTKPSGSDGTNLDSNNKTTSGASAQANTTANPEKLITATTTLAAVESKTPVAHNITATSGPSNQKPVALNGTLVADNITPAGGARNPEQIAVNGTTPFPTMAPTAAPDIQSARPNDTSTVDDAVQAKENTTVESSLPSKNESFVQIKPGVQITTPPTELITYTPQSDQKTLPHTISATTEAVLDLDEFNIDALTPALIEPTTYNITNEEETAEEIIDELIEDIFGIETNLTTGPPTNVSQDLASNTTATSFFTDGSTYSVILITSLCFGIIFFLVVIILVIRRVYDGWQKRHYSRIDYLVNGMYN